VCGVGYINPKTNLFCSVLFCPVVVCSVLPSVFLWWSVLSCSVLFCAVPCALFFCAVVGLGILRSRDGSCWLGVEGGFFVWNGLEMKKCNRRDLCDI
jgi:hypothetical protein